jgi:Domain of unknown function (DUF397)
MPLRAALRHTARVRSTIIPYSGVNGCVEVAVVGDRVAVRDSKDRGGPVLLFTSDEWEAFLAGTRDGEFDPPS